MDRRLESVRMYRKRNVEYVFTIVKLRPVIALRVPRDVSQLWRWMAYFYDSTDPYKKVKVSRSQRPTFELANQDIQNYMERRNK